MSTLSVYLQRFGDLWLLALVVLLSLAGCEKSQVGSPNTTAPKLKFVKSRLGGDFIVHNEFKYNENGQIQTRISYKDYASALSASKTECRYQGNRLVEKDEQLDFSSSSTTAQYVNGRSKFIYNGELVIQQNHYLHIDNNYTLRSFSVFTYDNKGHPVKQTRYTADGTLVGYTIYTYNGNNVVASEDYQQKPGVARPELAFKASYSYDTNKNPYLDVYQDIENIPFSVNANNITATTTVNYNTHPLSAGGLTAGSSTIYTYNHLGYPVSVNENGNEFLMVYE